MRNRTFIISTLLIAVFIILQSTVFSKLGINGIKPDLALIVLVFMSNNMGSIRGQMTGLIAGLIMDLLSSSPLGFHIFSRMIIGFSFGKIKGKLFLDSILMPVLFIISATVVKQICGYFITVIFIPESGVSFFSHEFLIELGFNAFLAPFIFALLKAVKLYRINERDEY